MSDLELGKERRQAAGAILPVSYIADPTVAATPHGDSAKSPPLSFPNTHIRKLRAMTGREGEEAMGREGCERHCGGGGVVGRYKYYTSRFTQP